MRNIEEKFVNKVKRAFVAALALACCGAVWSAEWTAALAVPKGYAFERRTEHVRKWTFPDFTVEQYRQANGPGTEQRVFVVLPKKRTGKCPAVAVPFYYPEAMLGFDPATGEELPRFKGVTMLADLARRGFVAATADAYHLTYRKDAKEPRDDFRRFRAFLVQPAVGIEIYPFTRAGFYLYAGVALTASIITNYEFYYHEHATNKLDKITGSTFGILPMVQVGLGYSWRLSSSWAFSVELMLQEGLVDLHYMNLDAYPMAATQNSKGIEMGSTSLTYTNRYGEKTMHWNDGWFQLGITVSYRWNTCETCRFINNYSNIKPARKR